MIEAVIFDFDGVIVESAGIKTKAFRMLFEDDYPDAADAIVAYHLSNEGISRYEKFRHIYTQILHEPLSEDRQVELGRRFSELALHEILEAPFVPGALEFLKANQDRRPLFLASGTPEEELHHVARTRGVDGYFREMHGTPRGKVEIVTDILSRHGWSPDRVAFVGDADSDLQAARRTGVHFIGRVAPDDVRTLGCEVCVEDLTGLEGLLSSM